MRKLKEFLKALNPWRIVKEAAKAQLSQVVEDEGNKLQAAVKKAVADKGPGAVDAAFDAFQAAIKARIAAL